MIDKKYMRVCVLLFLFGYKPLSTANFMIIFVKITH